MGDGSGGRASLTRALSRHVGSRAAAAKLRDDSTGFLGAALIIVAIIVAMIAAVILPAITTTMAVSLLGTAAGLIALVALASLVHLVVTDVRDGLRERRRAKRAASAGRGLGHGRLPAPAGVSGA